ncbi:MAG: hypothetical protein F6K55_06135 [Moorea sp. SIO4A3]|nr:hypothetical protein [Moorena sp. SIO4A3]
MPEMSPNLTAQKLDELADQYKIKKSQMGITDYRKATLKYFGKTGIKVVLLDGQYFYCCHEAAHVVGKDLAHVLKFISSGNLQYKSYNLYSQRHDKGMSKLLAPAATIMAYWESESAKSNDKATSCLSSLKGTTLDELASQLF